MERKENSLLPISYNIKNARFCTKKDTLQRLEADLHATQAYKYTKIMQNCFIAAANPCQREYLIL